MRKLVRRRFTVGVGRLVDRCGSLAVARWCVGPPVTVVRSIDERGRSVATRSRQLGFRRGALGVGDGGGVVVLAAAQPGRGGSDHAARGSEVEGGVDAGRETVRR